MSDWAASKVQLRETAKWISGGVVATAASVFAGSSLTNLGALSLPDDCPRLSYAAGGALLGFVALGILMYFAVRVLTVENFSINQLLADAHGGEGSKILGKIETEYKNSIAQQAPEATIKALKAKADDLRANKSTGYEAKLTAIAALVGEIAEVVSFRLLKARFDRLMIALPFTVLAALIGFGLFAWAANPPDKPAPERPGISLKITR